eukprot:TRINITY_DN2218_c0_g2_i2.p1 TRINITY_DN2218_c0_g2~~TRINITY_DN2218_c0_g2_i2.p1  ORF type:complete len:435 (+),score=31.83 TRINITY_DN2218_c0_g2_i2:386-1690(+)
MWALLNACGLNVGRLKQVMLCDIFASLPSAIPFMVMANVCDNVKIGTMVPVAIFMNSASPLGAFLIGYLDKNTLMFILAIVLLSVVIIQNVVPLIIKYYVRRGGKYTIHEVELPTLSITNSDMASQDEKEKQPQNECKPIELVRDIEANAQGQITTTNNADLTQTTQVQLENIPSQDQELQITTSTKYPCENSEINDEQEDDNLEYEDLEDTILLSKTIQQSAETPTTKKSFVSKYVIEPYKSTVSVSKFCLKIIKYFLVFNFRFTKDETDEELNVNFEFERREEITNYFNGRIKFDDIMIVTASQGWLKGYKWLILCGFMAGLTGSMVGVPGPPLIIMTQILDVNKLEARATQAALGFFNPRTLFLYAAGLFRMEDLGLYLLYTLFTLVGLAIGSLGVKFVSQLWFSRVLSTLVLVTAFTLILQSIGLIPQKA